jgi:hypothetical protein
VKPVVDEATFEAARRLREARDPKAAGVAQARTRMLPTLLARVIALDATLQTQGNTLRDQREGALAEMALAKREKPSARQVSPKQVAYACERLRTLLLDPKKKGYGKQLLRLLVTEIRVGMGTVEVTVPGGGAERRSQK